MFDYYFVHPLFCINYIIHSVYDKKTDRNILQHSVEIACAIYGVLASLIISKFQKCLESLGQILNW